MNDCAATDATVDMEERLAVISLASVIIVNYNGRSHLCACLNSLLESGDSELEILVVDNASSDGSADLVTRDYPQVRLILNEENIGFGGANNLAAAEAQGKYLVFLNQDTVVTAGWLQALITTLEADPTVGLATTKILLLDQPDRVNAAGNEIHITGLTLCRGLGDDQNRWDQPECVTAVSGAAFIIRRDLFVELDGFDADYFMYYEDTDLSLRARLLGYECRYVPDAVVYHDYKLRFGRRKTYYEERNRYISLIKTYHWATLFLLLPVWLLGEIITWGFVLIRDRRNWRNKFSAYANVLSQLPSILAKRRRLQLKRQVPDRVLLQAATYRLAFEQIDAGFATTAAHFVFTPLFLLLRGVLLFFLRW